MSPPLMLAIETATNVCSVAVAHGERITADMTLRRPRAHAESLVPMIVDALRYSGVERRDLDAVAVSMGPGSYTGLRIGVSTAKGLAMAVGAGLIGVSSLEALAMSAVGVAAPGDTVCALFNSRRNEVYAAAFRMNAQHALEATLEADVVLVTELPAWLGAAGVVSVCLVGEGVPRVLPVLQEAGVAVRALDPDRFSPSAVNVARLALPCWYAGHLADLAAFEPAYLKSFVAKKPTATAFEKLTF